MAELRVGQTYGVFISADLPAYSIDLLLVVQCILLLTSHTMACLWFFGSYVQARSSLFYVCSRYPFGCC